MNPFKPSSELLHAYLDQQLDEPTRLAVEAYLASHPDAAASGRLASGCPALARGPG